MINRIKENRKYRTDVSDYSVETWVSFIERNRLNLSPSYQRDYVWGFSEQQHFLRNLISGLPVSAISTVKEQDAFIYEVVDGKQRLTTLKMFVENEIPIHLNGVSIYYKDLTMAERNAFESAPLPMIRLYDANEAEKIKYFLSLNFAGVPQSEEHRKKLLGMLGELEMQ